MIDRRPPRLLAWRGCRLGAPSRRAGSPFLLGAAAAVAIPLTGLPAALDHLYFQRASRTPINWFRLMNSRMTWVRRRHPREASA